MLTFIPVSAGKRASSHYMIFNFAMTGGNVTIANGRHVSYLLQWKTNQLLLFARLVGIKMLGRGSPPNSSGDQNELLGSYASADTAHDLHFQAIVLCRAYGWYES